MEFRTLKAAVEALLYVSDTPVSFGRMREALGEGVEASEIREALSAIVQDFESDGRGVRLAELAGGFQITTRPEYAVYVKRLQKIRPPKLTAQALETLAIIAYRQPIIRAEIEAIRGVSSGQTLKTLLERRLIKIAGRQDVPGKPLMYSTTSEFLRYFGLRDLASLPPLRELERELGMDESTVLANLEPELPGLDGPEMERMAAEYRARKAALGPVAEEEPEAADGEQPVDLSEVPPEEFEDPEEEAPAPPAGEEGA